MSSNDNSLTISKNYIMRFEKEPNLEELTDLANALLVKKQYGLDTHLSVEVELLLGNIEYMPPRMQGAKAYVLVTYIQKKEVVFVGGGFLQKRLTSNGSSLNQRDNPGRLPDPVKESMAKLYSTVSEMSQGYVKINNLQQPLQRLGK